LHIDNEIYAADYDERKEDTKDDVEIELKDSWASLGKQQCLCILHC
jgi:hypothetical protein